MLLKIKAIPNAQRTEFLERMTDGTLKFRIHASPENGEANEELIDYLHKELKLRKAEIRLMKGANTRTKLIQIPDQTPLPW